MKLGTLATCTHITNVQLSPKPYQETPFRFQDLTDAVTFSRITRRMLWVVIGPDVDLFRVYPGGRVEDWSEPARRQAEKAKVPA
ncbi:MAG TPA: hypothetical protein VNH83_16675 [Bryobacteraceae bacterium]|nr:hypothetical protein [Bryobacteraceae bacterium]